MNGKEDYELARTVQGARAAGKIGAPKARQKKLTTNVGKGTVITKCLSLFKNHGIVVEISALLKSHRLIPSQPQRFAHLLVYFLV